MGQSKITPHFLFNFLKYGFHFYFKEKSNLKIFNLNYEFAYIHTYMVEFLEVNITFWALTNLLKVYLLIKQEVQRSKN